VTRGREKRKKGRKEELKGTGGNTLSATYLDVIPASSCNRSTGRRRERRKLVLVI